MADRIAAMFHRVGLEVTAITINWITKNRAVVARLRDGLEVEIVILPSRKSLVTLNLNGQFYEGMKPNGEDKIDRTGLAGPHVER